VLENAGKVSAVVAKELAIKQYELFDANRKLQGDADITVLAEEVKQLKR
jgi:hypothetical protein